MSESVARESFAPAEDTFREDALHAGYADRLLNYTLTYPDVMDLDEFIGEVADLRDDDPAGFRRLLYELDEPVATNLKKRLREFGERARGDPETLDRKIICPEGCLIRGEKGAIKCVNYDTCAEMILQHQHVIRFAENGKEYLYRNGVYVPFARDLLKKGLDEAFKGYSKADGQSVMTRNVKNEVLDKVFTRKTRTLDCLKLRKPLLNVKNGLLDMDTGALVPHTPDIVMLSQMDTAYDPSADCPKFKKFLGEVLDEKYHPALQELFGYSLEGDYSVQKAFMLIGPPRSGKGTTLRVIRAHVGETGTSNISLHQLCDDRFMRAELFGKKLNTFGDLPRYMLKNISYFLAATGQDFITAEFKGKDPFYFMNEAKLVFSTNKLPRIQDDSDAYYNRWIIFPFNKNSFLGKENPNLTNELLQELPGILNWALEGRQRLLKNGKFSYTEDVAGMYRRMSMPETAFLEDCCVASDSLDDYIFKADLVVAYNRWAKENGVPPATSKKAFGTLMMDQQTIPVATGFPNNPKADDKQSEAWRGIRFKEGLEHYME